MPSANTGRQQKRLLAISSLLYVERVDSRILPPSEISIGLVGQKAFGLSALPRAWTLPFLVVSGELLSEFRDSKTRDLNNWVTGISDGLVQLGLSAELKIYLGLIYFKKA